MNESDATSTGDTRDDRHPPLRHADRAAGERMAAAPGSTAFEATIHADFPYRHATRLLNPFQFRVGTLGLEAFDRNIEASLLFYAIHRAAVRAPGDRRVSVNACAASLRQSTETMRRAARVLVDHGLCRPVARGVERVPAYFDHPLTARIDVGLKREFDALLTSYEHSGLPLPPGIRAQGDDAVISAALDIHLSVMELTESRVTKATLLHVIGAVVVLNAATLASDPALGLRYGHDETVPPDALRCPASLKQIVAATGLPATTVWRHVTAAEKDGTLRRVGNDYLLSDAFMANPVVSTRSREKIAYVHRVFRDLAQGRLGRRPPAI